MSQQTANKKKNTRHNNSDHLTTEKKCSTNWIEEKKAYDCRASHNKKKMTNQSAKIKWHVFNLPILWNSMHTSDMVVVAKIGFEWFVDVVQTKKKKNRVVSSRYWIFTSVVGHSFFFFYNWIKIAFFIQSFITYAHLAFCSE